MKEKIKNIVEKYELENRPALGTAGFQKVVKELGALCDFVEDDSLLEFIALSLSSCYAKGRLDALYECVVRLKE